MLQSLTPFRTAGPESGGQVWAEAERRTFRQGEEIYGQGEASDVVYRLVRGAVRTTHLQADGRRHVGGFYYEDDILGVEIGDDHRFSAETLADCEVLALRRSGSATGDGGRIDRMMWAATSRELHRAQSHMLLLGRATACEKVARFLLELADRFSEGDFLILPMSRQDMADYLGLTIETISRVLGRLQADGVIELSGSRRCRIRRPAWLSGLSAG
jgi:CRP/FNR family transcriptional regulator, nitrogen fixation regulation protein